MSGCGKGNSERMSGSFVRRGVAVVASVFG